MLIGTLGPYRAGQVAIVVPASLVVRRYQSHKRAVGLELGYESAPGWTVFLRAGTRDDPDRLREPFTFGIGIGRARLRLDYAYDPMGDAGAAHYFGAHW
ncbi:MAG: hypothetical protein ACODAE_08040 [Gemmatimonadota bacterium]